MDPTSPERPRRAETITWITLLALVALLLQGLQNRNFADGDTGYHLAVAHYTAQHGILQDFPWTPFSWLGKHYADKELALHLLMVPVSGLDPNLASRIVGALLGAGLLGTLYLLLRAERAPGAGLWTLAAVASSGAFIYRFVIVRPHLMSIPLTLLIVWAGGRKRWGWLGFACFAFPFCYTAWHVPVGLGVIAAAVHLVTGDRRGLVAAPVAIGAVALGVLTHPNFPNNLLFFWIQNFEVLFATAWAGKEGIELGGEFLPFSTRGLARYVAVPALATALAIGLQVRERRKEPLLWVATAATLGFALLTSQTQRFIEYLAPLSMLTLALTLGPAADRRWASGALLGGLLWTGALGTHPLTLLRDLSVKFPPPVAEAMQRLVPTGAQVFHCEWVDVGEMMLALPDRKFLFALDPVLFYRGDRVAYEAWYTLTKAPPSHPAETLREVFGAEYVLCDVQPKFQALRVALAADPEIEGPIELAGSLLYRVNPAVAQPSSPSSPPPSEPPPSEPPPSAAPAESTAPPPPSP